MIYMFILLLAHVNTVFGQDCTMTVPANPLSANGLASPYILQKTGGCSQLDSGTQSFVECAIYDNAGNIQLYAPLVINQGDQTNVDYIPPVMPTVPSGATVGCWFGSNADTLTLTGPGASACVNGIKGSIFGQFSTCGGEAFMAV